MSVVSIEGQSVTDFQRLRLLLKDCATGFYQQMYFLGKDVSHAKGNQLQEFGFVRSPSLGLKGTSCYTLEKDGAIIELYGSCAGYYSDTTRMVFLRKRCRFYRWLPEEKLIAGQWSQKDISSGDGDVMFESLLPLLRWWVEYEKWIETRFEKGYRDWCHAEWKKVKGKIPWLEPKLALRWVEQFMEEKDRMIRPRKFSNECV